MPASTSSRLDFVIIGAQKAGSTFIQEAIGLHPDVYTPHGETSYFEDPDYRQDDDSPLVSALAAAKSEQTCGIKRPNYLGLPEVPARLASYAPESKLIAVLRDPRWRAISAYFHLMRSGLLPVCPMEDGLSATLRGDLDSQYPAARQLVEFGMYGRCLDRFFDHFPRERVFVSLYDEIKEDPISLARETYRFLGVDSAFLPSKAAKARPMPGIYSLPRQRFVAAFHGMFVEYFHNRTRIRQRRGLRAVGAHAVGYFDRFALSPIFKNERPKPSEELWRRLTDTYRDDVARLTTLLDRPLDAWLSAGPPK